MVVDTEARIFYRLTLHSAYLDYEHVAPRISQLNDSNLSSLRRNVFAHNNRPLQVKGKRPSTTSMKSHETPVEYAYTT